MVCFCCGSENIAELLSEIAVHMPFDVSARAPDEPHPMVFPKLCVCLECGFTDFKMTAVELRLIANALARNQWSSKQRDRDAELLLLLGEFPQIRNAHLFVLQLLREYPLAPETWLIPAPRSATSMFRRVMLFASREPAFPNLRDTSLN